MACPALPLCGLAIGEAERTLPDCNRRIRALLDRLQFPHDFPLVVRFPLPARGEIDFRPW